MSTPTLIDLPPHPADPVTPSEMGPGTPNSGTTSLSALSTTAIKDGHQGHNRPHGHQGQSARGLSPSSTMLDVERADRISRLAGLERVATVRPGQPSNLNPSSAPQNPPGYFDNGPSQLKERSTVGSASATESVGGRTTWASGSIDYEGDKMSEDQDDGRSSTGGMSDGSTSLVAFGEGAGSTVSAPISTATSQAAAARYAAAGSPSTTKSPSTPSYLQHGGTSMTGVVPASTAAGDGNTDARMVDIMSDEADVDPTTDYPPTSVSQSQRADDAAHRSPLAAFERGSDHF